MSPQLSYRTPAEYWTDALPIGNGRLGAMIFGRPQRDRWQINDDTCWSGAPASTSGIPASDEPTPTVVQRVRAAVFDDDTATAEREMRKVQFGHSQSYQPLAELEVEAAVPSAVCERRSLDLATGVSGWRATSDAGVIDQVAFASAPAQALLGRYSWPTPTEVTVRLSGAHAELGHSEVTRNGSQLVLISRMPADVFPSHDQTLAEAVRYDDAPGTSVTAVLVVDLGTDGELEPNGHADLVDGRLTITGAHELRLSVTSATDFVDPASAPHGDVAALVRQATQRAHEMAGHDFDALRTEHETEHRAMFDRFSLELSNGDAPETDVDVLLERAQGGDLAPELAALIVHYGRYLMMASSRPGSRAINLQGIWNPWLQPPWSSNYTVNINTQMNYWPAGPANLIDCAEPLYALVEAMAGTGAETARRVFDRPGWAAHHNADVWGYTLPVGTGEANPCWAAWPMAGFWLLRHLWEHYEYTGDTDFLITRAWPLLDGAVTFGLATLCELPDGSLGTAPSTSPENGFVASTGQHAAVTSSSTMDLALLRDVFGQWQSAATVRTTAGHPVDPDRAAQVAAAIARLPLPRPTVRGSYPEWHADLTEAEPKHRHQSHLYDVHPGHAINAYDPAVAELMSAARESLRLRGAYSTGWSLAWRISLHARLRNVDAAMTSLGYFLAPVPDEVAANGPQMAQAGGVYRNLFCAHPPFQIDGNFGATAGVIEMLVQSHGHRDGARLIDLLPCLPAQWPNGRLRGVRARGAITVDLAWADGQLTEATLTADHDQPLVIMAPGHDDVRVDLRAGVPYVSGPHPRG